jgi:hypothetical protein
MSYLRKYNDQ